MTTALVIVAVLAALVAVPPSVRRLASRRRAAQDLLAEAQTDWWPEFERAFRAHVRRRRWKGRCAAIAARIRRPARWLRGLTPSVLRRRRKRRQFV